MRKLYAVFGLVCLAACDLPPQGPVQLAPDDGAACPAARYTPAIGRRLADVPIDWPENKLRIIGPGQPVTMDYRPDRMTVSYDAAGRITGFVCG